MQRHLDWALALTALAALLVVAGCGGGTDEATATGGLEFTVNFPPLPDAAKLAVIYEATNSITIDIAHSANGPNVVPRVVINRPSPQGGQVVVLIPRLPAGPCLVKVQGWALEDGKGNLLSRVFDTALIVGGRTTTKAMVMEGYPYTIDLVAEPNPVRVDLWTTAYATPKAVNGETLLGTFAYQWWSTDESIAWPGAPALEAVNTTGVFGTGDQVFYAAARGTCGLRCKLIHQAPDRDTDVEQADVIGAVALVVQPNIDEVTVSPDTIVVASGTNADATATAKYQGEAVTDIQFSFTSDHPEVATVTKTAAASCRVHAVRGGTATITATQPFTNATGTIAVTVPEGGLDVIINGVSGS